MTTTCFGGYVGVGTNNPIYPLQVNSTNLEGVGIHTWFKLNTGLTYSTGADYNASIVTGGTVMASTGFIAYSDRRIKINIMDVDDDRALRDLRLLKPKMYTYKDVVSRGTEPVYGFIAQDVKEVLNHASNPINEVIPNIYELATFSGDILTLVFNTSDLSRDASGTLFSRLKLKTREEKEEFVTILEVIDEHTLRVNKDLSAWGGQLDGDKLIPGNQIFVYGQEVNDFHTLNKDAIWTVATAALQEVDRQLQAEKAKVVNLETTLSSMSSMMTSMLARLEALEHK
jgi:hypothetical protein